MFTLYSVILINLKPWQCNLHVSCGLPDEVDALYNINVENNTASNTYRPYK